MTQEISMAPSNAPSKVHGNAKAAGRMLATTAVNRLSICKHENAATSYSLHQMLEQRLQACDGAPRAHFAPRSCLLFLRHVALCSRHRRAAPNRAATKSVVHNMLPHGLE